MANLLFDIGNSNIVVGYCEDSNCNIHRFNTDVNKTSDEYNAIFKDSFAYENIDAILISSVVPKLTGTIKRFCEKYLNVEAQVVEPGYKTGVKLTIDNPKEVGSDLICGVAGAMRFSNSGIIIDMGTATKISYFKNNTFLGVVIAPGLKVSANSLTKSASQLSDFTLEKPARVFGRNTIECMQSGIIFGHIAMINGLVKMAEVELGEKLPIYVTGGLCNLVKDGFDFKFQHEDNLIIDALDYMIKKNGEQ